MYAERRAQISLYEDLRSIFEDETIWGNPFTIYGRGDWKPTFRGTYPWMFIVNADPTPSFQVQHLPVIVVETKLDVHEANEMGGGKYGLLSFAYHLFAENGAQRDDIAGAIVTHQELISIHDYDLPDAPVIETHRLIPNYTGAIWTQSPVSSSPYAPEWYTEQTTYGRVISSAIELSNL